MNSDISGRKYLSREQKFREIMNTPKKALNAAHAAAWTAIGIAAGLTVELMKWISVGGPGVILSFQPATIKTVELAAALILGALAYYRPAAWSISLVLTLLGLDASYSLVRHGFSSTIVIDAIFAFVATLSFQGVKRYAELQNDTANAGSVFD